MKNMKVQLVCPVCGFRRLIDAAKDNRSELKAEKEITTGWAADYFAKCPHCKSSIGIRKVS